MSRWIEADAFIKSVVKSGLGAEFINNVTALVIDTPSIDLVYCRECKFWSENTQFCHMFSTRFTAMRMLPNDFCSLGVKKENE